MQLLIYHSIHLFPELLFLLGIVVLEFIERRKARTGERGRENRGMQAGVLLLFLLVLLFSPVQGIFLAEFSPSNVLRFFSPEPLPVGSAPDGKVIVNKGLLVLDRSAIFFKTTIAIFGLIAAAGRNRISEREEEEKQGEELSARFLIGLLGVGLAGFLLVEANDLLILWGGVELLLLASRMTASSVHRRREYLYGGFFSALTLFGILLFYGLFGTTDLHGIGQALSIRNAESVPVNGLLIALLLVVGGIASRLGMGLAEITPFKRSGFGISLFRSLALFVLMVLVGYAGPIRLVVGLFPPDLHGLDVHALLLVLGGIIGIGCGLLMAGSEDLLHGLRYGVGAHLGIALLALASRSTFGLLCGTFYLLLHLLLTLAAFGALRTFPGGQSGGLIEELRGKGRFSQMNGLFAAILLGTLAGAPFTGGFLARFFLFSSLTEEGNLSLVAFGLGGAVSILLLYAYGRPLYALYFSSDRRQEGHSLSDDSTNDSGENAPQKKRWSTFILLGCCAAGTLFIGFPTGFYMLWEFFRLAFGAS